MKRKKLIRIISALCMVVLLAVVFAGCEASGTTTYSFEKGKDNSIDGWTIYSYRGEYESNAGATEITISDSGNTGKCLSINNITENDARVYKTLDVAENSNYLLGVWIKTENIDGGAGANISGYDCQGTALNISGTTDWTYYECYLKTSDGQKSVALSLGVGGYGAESVGHAYFDELSVKKVSSVPENATTLVLTENSKSESEEKTSVSIWFKLLFVLVMGSGIAYCIFASIRADKHNAEKQLYFTREDFGRFEKNDVIMVLVMTLITGIFSFVNLGSTKGCPSNYWKPATDGEYAEISFEEESTVSRVTYYTGIASGSGKMLVQYLDENGTYQTAVTIDNDDVNFYKWHYDNVSFTTKTIRVYAEEAGIWLNEVGFYSKDAEGELVQIALDQDTLGVNYTETSSSGKAENLFDEQDDVCEESNLYNSTYFDEIYFPRTAYEQLNGMSIYERTHPPLGKILMSIGILIFGMNTFGWRFMGTLFGVMLVPLIYAFALKVFKKRIWAFSTAFLIMFDFMRLTQSRLATIDTYTCFFTIAMYYFMYDYFMVKSYDLTTKKSLKPLLFCGIMFGLGAASKWTSLYSGLGLAIIWAVAKFTEILDVKDGRAVVHARSPKSASKSKGKSYGKNKLLYKSIKDYIDDNLVTTIAACVLFFIIIPVIIYVLAYIPYMPSNSGKSLLQVVINNQKYMYNYHSNLTATHSYGSKWYTWPLIVRPIWYFVNTNCGEGMKASISAMGNPVIWWIGIPCMFSSCYIAWKKKDKTIAFFLIGYLCQYAPWILINRVCFIYHYFTALPFTLFFIVYTAKELVESKTISKYVFFGYLALVFILFVAFYPALTGIPVKREYLQTLEWFSTWNLGG